MNESKFNKWFEEQHGNRNYNYGRAEENDEDLKIMVTKGEWAKKELEARRVYDARKDYAPYAWNARTK